MLWGLGGSDVAIRGLSGGGEGGWNAGKPHPMKNLQMKHDDIQSLSFCARVDHHVRASPDGLVMQSLDG